MNLNRAPWAALLAVGACLALAGPASAAPADLDPGFGGNGVAAIDAGGTDGALALTVQPDGKVVVVGHTLAGDNILVSRLNADGTLDRTFDGDGVKSIDLLGTEFGHAVAVQPDGKIVVVGISTFNSTPRVVVQRLHRDGTVDTTLGTSLQTAGTEATHAVAIQPRDGKIIVAGATAGNDALVSRLTPTGDPDPTFGSGGRQVINGGGTEFISSMALQPDGKIVLAGSSRITSADTFVYRLTSTGAPDPTFGSGGQKRIVGSPSDDWANGVAVQPDGKIVVAGYTAAGRNATAYRLEPTGALDLGFGDAGALSLDSGGDDWADAVAVQPDGKVVLAGTSGTTLGQNGVVHRLLSDGTHDPRFGADGELQINAGGFYEAFALALQTDGRILLAGGNRANALVLRLLGGNRPADEAPPPPAGAPPGPGAAPGVRDADGDGVLPPADCRDNDRKIHPGAEDIPGDRIDQDCRGGDARFPVLDRNVTASWVAFPSGYTSFTAMAVSPVRKGDVIRVTCRGRGCPRKPKTIRVKKDSRRVSLVDHLRKRKLRKGAVVDVRVTRANTVGRVHTWQIRGAKRPRVIHGCLNPGPKPSACPA